MYREKIRLKSTPSKRKSSSTDGSSIFTAEAKAIDLALDFINESNLKDKFIIFSDSMSVLQALNHTSSKNPQIQKLLIKHHTVSELKTIIYCWVPSHRYIWK